MENSQTPKLGEQLCFPFYLIAKEIANLYRPFLEELGITYPQYLVMMILWEEQPQTVNQIGEKLTLDSGTLTPLLKRLEAKGYLTRKRKVEDERVVQIFLTDEGTVLQHEACLIPGRMNEKLGLTDQDLCELKNTLHKLLTTIKK
ncbi:MarR family transcriptional regulator [Chryseobacterium sp. 6424]|uniref:MarR family winged helix-turn-helix transcriptional regulator n=1 Tax=Chryseobacterium sp. 6424 TaxID=2039166 RepID=UPI000EFD0647|nr:MarR family transcriptional regulator [Chryseobacterium sp. 6424]AYO57857.1 MarR family transcriptional regulator [Chryseobacterium sp. 6424]